MKKQLLLLTLSALSAASLTASMRTVTKHKGHRSKQNLPLQLRTPYREAFTIIRNEAPNLSASDKENLINNLIGYFNGSTEPKYKLHDSAATIFKSVTDIFNTLKKSEKSGRLGQKYSRSKHFAQKALGMILLPSLTTEMKASSTSSVPLKKAWSGTKPIGPERKSIRTKPVGPEVKPVELGKTLGAPVRAQTPANVIR